MEKLIQVLEQEIQIDFKPDCKCRSKINLKSLSTAAHVAFKVQTSAPHKFLVSPPNGLIPPSSSASFHVILKPQTQIPKSPSDRFLLRTAPAPDGLCPTSVAPWLSSAVETHDLKLKVVYVGPFLLRRAVDGGDVDAVRRIVKRRSSGVGNLSPAEARSMLQSAAGNDKILKMLVEAGIGAGELSSGRMALSRPAARDGHAGTTEMVEDFSVGGEDGRELWALNVAKDKGHIEVIELPEHGESVMMAARRGDLHHLTSLLQKGVTADYCDQYGLTALHSAAIKGHAEVVAALADFGVELECEDVEGHTPLHLAVEGGSLATVQTLINRGARVHPMTKKGVTPLDMATSIGYDDISRFLLSGGVASSSL